MHILVVGRARLASLHRDGFSQIPQLTHIRPSRRCCVMRKQVQRHDMHGRRECAVVLGQADDVQPNARVDVRIGVGEHGQLATVGERTPWALRLFLRSLIDFVALAAHGAYVFRRIAAREYNILYNWTSE